MGLAVACTSGTDGGTAGNTELNLDIVNPGCPETCSGTGLVCDTNADCPSGETCNGATSCDLGFSVDRVDYRITCAGNPNADPTVGTPPYPIPPSDTNGSAYTYDDSVDISGAFETVDTRVPPVWQAVEDLPPGPCTVTLSVWDGNEVVCIGSQTLQINEDETTKYDIVLVCSLSIDSPDGRADVDGTFEFITGNLCPKVYTLNGIPSGNATTPIPVQPGGPYVGQAVTEIQYRAADPDKTCGDNCDPQNCNFENPPVCTPAVYNPNDPLCNPLVPGGDPNSAECLAGGAGLVCTIAAIPLSSGVPGGTFISPNDLVTPVGPVLPVNLDTASGIPGIILPGLGGPVTTSSAPTVPATGPVPGVNYNPLYPGLPNVNGQLPPLFYSCDLAQPGPVLINLDCSDGDAECDKNMQLLLTCPGENFCFSQPIDCDATGECLLDGTCDPFCDPADVCDRCPGQDLPAPVGASCTIGGTVCDGAGNCVECLADADCLSILPPVDCQLNPTCVANSCVAGGTAPSGTACSNGVCDGSGIGSTDPPCVFQAIDPPLTSLVINVGCGNNVTADVSILPYALSVDPTAILAGQDFTVDLDGVAEFSEDFLDAAQGAVPGGVTAAGLVDLVATVQTRGAGATGANVPLGAGSAIPFTCVYGGACDPANNGPSVPGLQPNSDCVPTGKFNPCSQIVIIPTSNDCAPGGLCEGLGKASQCVANGFCVTSGLPLPLDGVTGVPYTAGDGVTPGQTDALFGWYDNPAILSPGAGQCGTGTGGGANCNADADCAGGETCDLFAANGTYTITQPTYTGVAGPVGLAVNAGGLAVQLECIMAEAGGDDSDGDTLPDEAIPSPDSSMIQFTVQVP
jgi:hypothetical protein